MKKIIFLLLLSSQLTAQNWTMVLDSYSARNFFCFDADTVYVTGLDTLYVSTNSGNNWAKIHTPYLVEVFFPNSKTGYGFNDLNKVLYKTTDSGNSWDSIFYSPYLNTTVLHFLNNEIGFICILNQLYKTSNGGLQWNACFNLPVGAFQEINDSVYVVSAGDGQMYKSMDRGNTWISKGFIPLLRKFFKVNDSIIYGGDLYRTIDGGETWETRNNYPCTSGGDGIYFFNKDSGIVCGYDMPGGCIYYTYDGGLTIYPFSIEGNSEYFFDVVFLPNSCTGYILGGGKLYKSTDCWGPTKVDEIEKQSTNEIYYNSETNCLILPLKEESYILLELTNTTGNVVYCTNIENHLKLKSQSVLLPSNLLDGFYLIKLTSNNNKIITSKILIY